MIADMSCKGRPSVRLLRATHLFAAGLHLAWSAGGLALMPDVEVTVPVYYVPAAWGGPNVVAPGEPRVEFRYYTLRVLLWFPFVTAMFHLVYASLPGAGGVWNRLRWLEYAITATMLTMNAVVGSGVMDYDAFLAIVVLMVGMQGAGLGLDIVHGKETEKGMRPLLLAIGFANLAVVVTILGRHANELETIIRNRMVAALYGIYYFSFGVSGTLRAYDVWLWSSSAWTELVYAVLSLSAKTSLFWLSYGGTMHALVVFRGYSSSVDWAAVQSWAAYGPGSLALAALAVGGASYDLERRQVVEGSAARVELASFKL